MKPAQTRGKSRRSTETTLLTTDTSEISILQDFDPFRSPVKTPTSLSLHKHAPGNAFLRSPNENLSSIETAEDGERVYPFSIPENASTDSLRSYHRGVSSKQSRRKHNSRSLRGTGKPLTDTEKSRETSRERLAAAAPVLRKSFSSPIGQGMNFLPSSFRSKRDPAAGLTSHEPSGKEELALRRGNIILSVVGAANTGKSYFISKYCNDCDYHFGEDALDKKIFSSYDFELNIHKRQVDSPSAASFFNTAVSSIGCIPLAQSPQLREDRELDACGGLFEGRIAQEPTHPPDYRFKVTLQDTEGGDCFKWARETFVYKFSDILILCFSTVDRKSFEQIKSYYLEEVRNMLIANNLYLKQISAAYAHAAASSSSINQHFHVGPAVEDDTTHATLNSLIPPNSPRPKIPELDKLVSKKVLLVGTKTDLRVNTVSKGTSSGKTRKKNEVSEEEAREFASSLGLTYMECHHHSWDSYQKIVNEAFLMAI